MHMWTYMLLVTVDWLRSSINLSNGWLSSSSIDHGIMIAFTETIRCCTNQLPKPRISPLTRIVRLLPLNKEWQGLSLVQHETASRKWSTTSTVSTAMMDDSFESIFEIHLMINTIKMLDAVCIETKRARYCTYHVIRVVVDTTTRTECCVNSHPSRRMNEGFSFTDLVTSWHVEMYEIF